MGISKWKVGLVALLMMAACAVEASAQGPGGRGGPGGGRGGRPSFDKLLDAFDANGDGTLELDEVPPRVWARLSQADADGDGSVTRAEFNSHRP